MKRNLIYFTLLLLPIFSIAQHQFYPFNYNDKSGLSDEKGNEILAPIYNYWRESEDKKLLIFRPDFNSKENTLCFDVASKQGKKYKTFYEDEVTVQKIQHHFVEELTGKKYLLNSKTGEMIRFKDDVYTLNDLNDHYIIAKYYSREIITPKVSLEKEPYKKVKGKIPPPPPPKKSPDVEAMESADYYIIYSSTNDLKPVLQTKAKQYFLLNKEIPNHRKDENGNVVVQIIERNLNDFDFILFENNGAYQLYDKNFKLIKKFTSKPSPEYAVNEEALKKCETFSGSKIENERGAYPSIGMASEDKREEPKFEIQRENDTYFLISKNNGKSKKILSSPHKLEYTIEGKLWIQNEKADKTTSFKFDENTFQLYIPQKYLGNLGVKIL